jgi:hypothetical protein
MSLNPLPETSKAAIVLPTLNTKGLSIQQLSQQELNSQRIRQALHHNKPVKALPIPDALKDGSQISSRSDIHDYYSQRRRQSISRIQDPNSSIKGIKDFVPKTSDENNKLLGFSLPRQLPGSSIPPISNKGLATFTSLSDRGFQKDVAKHFETASSHQFAGSERDP